MTLVIDTSVAVKWVTPEPGLEHALELVARPLVAPDLFQAEIANVLTKKLRSREFGEEQARFAFRLILSRVPLLPTGAYGDAAFELSLSLHHSVYDCYFLAAAEALGKRLVTADRTFAEKVRSTERASLIYLLGEEIP
ncbi:MAG TPA: type II toxin-antitoxin system VapC family toxin [Allosphingosinicella sp.]